MQNNQSHRDISKQRSHHLSFLTEITNQSLSELKIHLATNYVIGKINSLSISYVIKLWVKDFVIIYFSIMKIIARAKKHYVT